MCYVSFNLVARWHHFTQCAFRLCMSVHDQYNTLYSTVSTDAIK